MRKTAVAAALAALALAPAAEADAKAPLFKVTVKGSQVSTWENRHDPQSACDFTVRGNGSQQVRYDNRWSGKLALVKQKGKRAYLLSMPNNPFAEGGLAVGVNGRAEVVREGEEKTTAPGPPCAGTGGWDGSQPDQRCDERRLGRISLEVLHERGRLEVTGRYANFVVGGAVGPRTKGQTLGHTFEFCPFWPAGNAVSQDRLLPASGRVSARRLLGLAPGRSLKVSGSKREPAADGDFKGDTLHAWNATFRRVR